MSNELSEYCRQFNLDPIACMNLLTEWNVISDNCISLADVAPADEKTAIGLLRLNKNDLKVSE